MATYDICDTRTTALPLEASGPRRLFAPFGRLYRVLAARIEERRAIHQLYRLDARVLRDMGFDPRAIYAAREGAISEWKSRRCGGSQ